MPTSRAHRILAWTVDNWKSVCVTVSLTATLLLYLVQYLLPTVKISEQWMFSAVYLGVMSIVFLLLEVRRTLVGLDKPHGEYSSLRPALDDLHDDLRRATESRRGGVVTLEIVGNRLSVVSSFLTEVLRRRTSGDLGTTPLRITVFHSDPAMSAERGLPVQANKLQVAKEKQVLHAAQMEDSIRALFHERENTKESTELEFIRYHSEPYFYSFLINGSIMYQGWFTWKGDIQDWTGPSNPCTRLEARLFKSDRTIEWVKNRMLLYRSSGTHRNNETSIQKEVTTLAGDTTRDEDGL